MLCCTKRFVRQADQIGRLRSGHRRGGAGAKDGEFGALQLGSTIFAQPGLFELPLIPLLCDGLLACQQEVRVDRGAGWEALGALGALSSITATLPPGYNQEWLVQAVASNGQTSTVSVTVTVDSAAPSAQITPMPVLLTLCPPDHNPGLSVSASVPAQSMAYAPSAHAIGARHRRTPSAHAIDADCDPLCTRMLSSYAYL